MSGEQPLADLAEKWIAFWRAPERSAERTALTPAVDNAWKLCANDPDGAWAFILEILRRDQSNAVLEALGAGPIEDLLAKHAGAVIDRLEAEAAANPIFAGLLAGVWQNEMPDAIWQRVQAAANPG